MSEGRLEDIFVTTRRTGRTAEEYEADVHQGGQGNETSTLGYQVLAATRATIELSGETREEFELKVQVFGRDFAKSMDSVNIKGKNGRVVSSEVRCSYDHNETQWGGTASGNLRVTHHSSSNVKGIVVSCVIAAPQFAIAQTREAEINDPTFEFTLESELVRDGLQVQKVLKDGTYVFVPAAPTAIPTPSPVPGWTAFPTPAPVPLTMVRVFRGQQCIAGHCKSVPLNNEN
jgi:hypothetical protein